MKAESLQIYIDTERIIKAVLGYTKNVSREVKYQEWSELRTLLWKAHDVIYLANRDVATREKFLADYLEYIQGVRSRLRMLHEEKYIPLRFATHILNSIENCEKQALAWRNRARKTRTDEL